MGFGDSKPPISKHMLASAMSDLAEKGQLDELKTVVLQLDEDLYASGPQVDSWEETLSKQCYFGGAKPSNLDDDTFFDVRDLGKPISPNTHPNLFLWAHLKQ
jgi:hypothetical protein